MLSEEAIISKLQSSLKPSRFQHSMNVRDAAVELALIYNADVDKCRLAGTLHDCAKNMSNEEMLAVIEQGGVELYPNEDKFPQLLHAPAGAALAKLEYGVTDSEVLSAIRKHTTGKDMSLIEAIIFVADLTEKGRMNIPHIEEMRRLSKQDIYAAADMCKMRTKEYCEEMGYPVFSI